MYVTRYDDRTASYCAPTWSWASVRSQVTWDDRIFDMESRVHVMEAVGIPEGYDLTSRVRAGSVVLLGSVQAATIDLEGGVEPLSLGLRNNRGNVIHFWPDQNPPSGDETDHMPGSLQRSGASLKHGEQVLCLKVLMHPYHKEAMGLVLTLSWLSPSQGQSRTGLERSETADLFERVGLISDFGLPKYHGVFMTWFAEAQEATVIII